MSNNPWEGFIDLDALKEKFERVINAEVYIYNLTPSEEESRSYWSLHTERAWKVFQLGARAAL
jgi:hypothetical protein